jgi:hypothetical protein
LDVGCERCHGPGRAHVEAARAGRPAGEIYRFRGASSETTMALCGQCHRSPQPVSTEEDLASIEDLPRFAHTALVASACYQRSAGRLTCLTCHRSHDPLSKDTAAYVRVCQSCHTGHPGGSPACPVNRTSGCVGCHMPASVAGFPGGSKFHTHWIKVYEELRQKRASAPTAAASGAQTAR